MHHGARESTEDLMSLTPKSGKKDREVQERVLRELAEERERERIEPHYKHANRDQARGDWDRSGEHGDEEVSG
jgi:hypothetical protein